MTLNNSIALNVLVLLVPLLLADSVNSLQCPFAARDVEETSARWKRNSISWDSSDSTEILLKNILPNYLEKSGAATTASEKVQCGIPPSHCLNNLRYRTIDGSCNNLVHREFGIAINIHRRLLPPRYGDKVYTPGLSLDGTEQPNSRLLSLAVYGEDTLVDKYRTVVAMQWGQFVAHDISLLTTKGAPKDCCEEPEHKSCYPISLPSNGPIAYHTGKSCLSFARALTNTEAVCPKTDLPYSEKLTTTTAYLDLSSVYGNWAEQSKEARLHKGGKLRTSYENNQHWLPVTQNLDGKCGTNDLCYDLPDSRNRFTPTIAVLQVLFVREHNRLAEQLALVNPRYTDEQLFQEARKINIAQFQKITYYDWLPLFTGRNYALQSGLIYNVSPTQHVNDYDESVNAGPYAEFSAAAFRYGHNTIPGWFSIVAPDRKSNQTFRLSDYFERQKTISFLATGDNYDALVRGLVTQLQKRSDGSIDREIKHYFNRKDTEEYGSDLKALDIQRARDFGLASYNDAREFCGLRRANTWNDFASEIPREKIETLRSFYATPNDVELSVGGSLEAHAPDALFGPTFRCIVVKQFLNTRRGDRFFYEHESQQSGFTTAQLAEIRKITLASLFCRNSKYLQRIQPNVFVFPNKQNYLLDCNEIPKLDISKWREFY